MIPAERAHLHIAATTHPGMSGKNNEDRYIVSAFRLEGEASLPAVLAVISDGVGGHRAGEVAAGIVVETILQEIAKSDGLQPLQALRAAIQQASQAVFTQAQAEESQRGMAATCACALVIENRLFTASVGDSRIYLLSGDSIQQLTTDHTWIQEALDAGVLTEEEARNHPNAHVIRRYLGAPQPVEADLRLRLSPDETEEQILANQGLVLQPGDQVILCSDGLTDLVTSQEILPVAKGQDQEKALQVLTNLANQRGGHDNITIIALQMPVSIAETAPTRVIRKRSRPKRGLTCGIGVALLALLAILMVGGYWLVSNRVATVTPTPDLTGVPALSSTPALATPTAPPRLTQGTPDTSPAPITPSAPVLTPPSTTFTPWPTNTRAP
jgi:serine/threonine protein phosphatase PrpC